METARKHEQSDIGTNGYAAGADQTPVPSQDRRFIMPDEFYRQFVARQDGRTLLEKLSQVDHATRTASPVGGGSRPNKPLWPKTNLA